jgi:aryl-alcohol dehydrogenase-like predicted oxidoreductase
MATPCCSSAAVIAGSTPEPGTLAAATRNIGQFEVSSISYGAMCLSHAYGHPPSTEDGGRLLNQALDAGYTMLDTAALYGFGDNETLIGNSIGHRRDEYVLASKCALHGVDGKRELTNDPAKLRRSCEESLRRLKTDVIDLFYLHRYDKLTPLEDSVGLLGDLVAEGKVREIGLSEVSADTLRKAHAVHPIAAVQTEYSLWTREPEIAVLEACRDIGAAFVAFSPLARGFLTGALRDVGTLVSNDFRRGMPRFFPENYPHNLALLGPFETLASSQGCTMGQLALAWLLHVDDNVVPIPGTTSPAHLEENLAALDVELDAATVAEAGRIINRDTVTGDRYAEATQAEIDTEQFEEA